MLLCLVIVLAALILVGAFCNVLSGALGIGIMPAFPGSEWFFFVKNYVGDLILWLAVLAMVMMVLAVLRERRLRGRLRHTYPRRRPLDDPRICVVLTAYDDEQSIAGATLDFRSQPHVETVIVVDNNCSDGTAARAAAAGATVVKESQQGYGHACTRGLRAALEETDADLIVLAEGDSTFSGHDIAKMLPFLEDADFVVGNRVTPGLIDTNSQMDTFFVWGNQLGAKFVQLRFWDWRFLGKVRLSDVGCTFRAIRREALAEIIDELNVGGSHFSPHMIMVSLRKGHTIVEVPVTFWPRVGASKGANSFPKAVGIGAAMFWHILTFPARARTASAAVEAQGTSLETGRTNHGR